jgi:hypothetical protein
VTQAYKSRLRQQQRPITQCKHDRNLINWRPGILTFVCNFERITLFEEHHSLLAQMNSVFNIKHVYDKTTSKNQQILSLSVNIIASYILTQIFVVAIDLHKLCFSCTPMFVDRELWAIQSWKRMIWQYTICLFLK